MRVKIERLGEGQHPSEVFVAVKTVNGEKESLIVDKRSVDNDSLDIGYPVGGDDQRYLIELPRETTSGQWRIWVDRNEVMDRVPA